MQFSDFEDFLVSEFYEYKVNDFISFNGFRGLEDGGGGGV